ncbi:MAG: hypothetical protein KC731_34745, partial [Myxococcales bacterium]|nr:hypothetical protein [Myxococcales bacterium]
DDPEIEQQDEASTASFHRHLVLADEALLDADALDATAIQAFFEHTPYGTRSGLADVSENGRSAATIIADAAHTYGISPLVLLARIQLEQSLVASSNASPSRLKKATGCGCPDGGSCSHSAAGFTRQIDCAAERFSTYLEEMKDGGTTIAGWRVGKAKKTLDGYTVIPQNATTAAIYTYTPWVYSARDYLTLFKKFADFLDYQAPGFEGCGVATFPSGLRVQLQPNAALAAEMGDGTHCFLDPERVSDPISFDSYPTSVKLSPNFSLRELAEASSGPLLRLEPALVEAVQALRESLGSAVTIETAFMPPSALAALCDDDGALCSVEGFDATSLSSGRALVVSSHAGQAALLGKAAAAGFATCAAAPEGVYVSLDASGHCD